MRSRTHHNDAGMGMTELIVLIAFIVVLFGLSIGYLFASMDARAARKFEKAAAPLGLQIVDVDVPKFSGEAHATMRTPDGDLLEVTDHNSVLYVQTTDGQVSLDLWGQQHATVAP